MLSLSLFLLGVAVASVQGCGERVIQPDFTTYIVGGTPAKQGTWPWQVSIRINYLVGPGNYHTCGGTLIDNQWVLTAAHCFDSRNMDPADYEIVLGNHEENTNDPSQQSFFIEKVINHENFDSRTFQNDITLLKLSIPVVYDNYIQPACLPSKNWPAGTYTWITGWGNQETEIQDETLQQVSVPTIDTVTCNQKLWYDGEVYDDVMFCAGYEEGGQDSCQGDSGGPVVVENGGIFEVIGITSWGYGCADARNPGVYTRVHSYLGWISDNKV